MAGRGILLRIVMSVLVFFLVASYASVLVGVETRGFNVSGKSVATPVHLDHVVWDDGADEHAYAIAVTNDSGYVVVGYGHGDMLVVKFDGNNTVQWKKYIDGGSTVESLVDVICDEKGYIVAVGFKRNTATGRDDFVMIKMDVWGNVLWTKITNDSNPNGAGAVLFDPADKTYVVAGRWGTSEAHAHVWKYDENGTLIWDADVSRSDYGWNTLTDILIYNESAYAVFGYGDGPSGTKDVFVEILSRSDAHVIMSKSLGSPYYSDNTLGFVKYGGDLFLSTLVGNSYTEVYELNSSGNISWSVNVSDAYISALRMSIYNNTLVLVGYNQNDAGYANVSIVTMNTSGGITGWHNDTLTSKDYVRNICWNGVEFYLVGNTTMNGDDVLVAHYILDLAVPNLIIMAPVEGEYLNETNVTVAWWGSDDVGVGHYEVLVDNGTWMDVGLSNKTSITVSEGSHRVYVKAVDLAGNENISQVDFYVDTYAPSIRIESPIEGAYLNTSGVQVAWAADDDYGIDHYEIRVDSGSWNDVGSQNATMVSVSEGSHRVYVKAIDLAGNENMSHVDFYVDTHIPSISIVSPAMDSYQNSTEIVVMWGGNDNYGVDHYAVKMDNGSWINVGLSTTYTFTGVSEGNHVFYVKSVDTAGNTNVTFTRIVVDVTPPHVTIAPVKAYLNSSEVEIRWDSTDNNGILQYEVMVDNGNWTYVGSNISAVLNLSDGNHTVWVKAVDYAGNYNISSVRFCVDTKAPVIHNFTVKQMGENVLLRYAASDSGGSGVNYYLVRIDDGEWINTTYGELRVTNLTPGMHLVTVRAYDRAGNFVEKEFKFYVSPQIPWLWIIIGVIAAMAVVAGVVLFGHRRNGKAQPEKSEEIKESNENEETKKEE